MLKAMIMIEQLDMDYVIIAGGQRVNRPTWYSRMQWLYYWETMLLMMQREGVD